jgi:hypothetical protein
LNPVLAEAAFAVVQQPAPYVFSAVARHEQV